MYESSHTWARKLGWYAGCWRQQACKGAEHWHKFVSQGLHMTQLCVFYIDSLRPGTNALSITHNTT